MWVKIPSQAKISENVREFWPRLLIPKIIDDSNINVIVIHW